MKQKPKPTWNPKIAKEEFWYAYVETILLERSFLIRGAIANLEVLLNQRSQLHDDQALWTRGARTRARSASVALRMGQVLYDLGTCQVPAVSAWQVGMGRGGRTGPASP